MLLANILSPAMAVTCIDMSTLYNVTNRHLSLSTPRFTQAPSRSPAQDIDYIEEYIDAINIRILSDLQQWCVIRETKAQIDCMPEQFRLLYNQQCNVPDYNQYSLIIWHRLKISSCHTEALYYLSIITQIIYKSMSMIVDITKPTINQTIVQSIVLFHIIVIIQFTFRKLFCADYYTITFRKLSADYYGIYSFINGQTKIILVFLYFQIIIFVFRVLNFKFVILIYPLNSLHLVNNNLTIIEINYSVIVKLFLCLVIVKSFFTFTNAIFFYFYLT